MLEQLTQLDYQLFFAINQKLSNPFFDWLMPLLRNRFFWSPLYVFLIAFWLRQYGKHGFLVIAFFLLTFAITDFCNSGLIKPAFERLRPCNNAELKELMNTRVACGSGFSFPSSHAANHFALAMFLIITFYKKWRWIILFSLSWALAISFAQVYVGVHFPSDILFGCILGSMIGYLTGTTFSVIYSDKQWFSGS